jgi:hypothetical protein
MPYDPPPDLSSLSLAQIAELAAAQKLAPIEQWHPEKRGDSEMRIAANGKWYHQGGEITRPAMVRAFSALLRRDGDDGYSLVTPYEQLSIIVDDAPFQAVEVHGDGQGHNRRLAFRLNTDDLLIAGADHRIEFRPTPYIHVRSGLWAKLSRPVYYELVELALSDGCQPIGLWSDGVFFPIETP